MLRSKNRLKLSSDFDELYKEGTRYRGEYGMLICGSSDVYNSPRFGFVVSKKIGNAIERHRFQRRVRHIVKEYLDLLNKEGKILEGSRCSYIAYKPCDDFQKLKTDLLNILESAKEIHAKD